MNGWSEDLRDSIRKLRRSPGFAAVTVGTLGLAMGANAGIFSVVDTVLLRPLPYEDADRLVYIAATAPGTDFPEEFAVAPEFWLHYKENARLLEDVAIYNSFTATLRVGDRVERVRFSMPTSSLFSTLQVSPILGRLPVPEDDDRVAVISHSLWTTWFGSDPAVLGRSYMMAGGMRTVVGVMGPEFRFPRDDVLAWIPWVLRAEGFVPGRFGLVEGLVARTVPGATTEAVAAELAPLARQLPERFGGSAGYAQMIEKHRPVVRPLHEQLVGGVSGALWALMGSVGIVLLIACANVANLFMVRGERKQRDLAVRRALGAGRSRLFRSQMAEALSVALLGGVAAVLLAWACVPAVLRVAPPEIPRLGDVAMTIPTLAFTFALSVVSGVLCGLVPALRSSAPNMKRLRDGGRGSTRRRHGLRDGLVVAQTALALVLLAGSGLLIRSFLALRSVDPGYETKDILTFQFAPEGDHLPDAPAYARFHTDFMERLANLPGVEDVGVVENVPLNEGTDAVRLRTEETAADPDGGKLARMTFAGGDYFRTMGIEVLAGRPFTRDDNSPSSTNVIVSKSAANLLWPGQDPIGRRVQYPGTEIFGTVVGVVEDVLQESFRQPPEPVVYFPLVGPPPTDWVISTPAYVVKTKRAESIVPEIREMIREVAPEAPMYRVFTMAGLVADSMIQLSFTLLLLGVTSILALILGTVGLYSVLSNVVAERRREIGVRLALGAETMRVRGMVVAQGARVVAVGIAVGIVAAIACTRALRGLLFNVQPIDGATFLAVAVTMALVGMLASYIPAHRASRVDPIESLQAD
jgi:predicted permease